MDPVNNEINEIKEYKTNNYLCCSRKFQIKHKKLQVVKNEKLSYLGICIYILRKTYNKIHNNASVLFNNKTFKLYSLLFLSFFIFYQVFFFIYNYYQYNKFVNQCFNDGIRCKVIQTNCLQHYNFNNNSRNNNRNLINCIRANYKGRTMKEYLSDMFTIMFVWSTYINVIFVVATTTFIIISEIIHYLIYYYNNAKTKVSNVYIEYIPEVEEV